MVISDNWIWLHFPKTGGTATEKILRSYFSEYPDVIFDDLDDKSNPVWHQTVAERQKLNPDFTLGERRVFANIRRLPTWLLSRVHFEVQRRGDRAVPSRERLVNGQFKVINGATPKSTEKIVSADTVMKKFSKEVTDWIRMEQLGTDLQDAFGILKREGLTNKRVNDTRQAYIKNPRFWFTRKELKMMYEANPTWARVERKVYGNTLVG